ncbi:MAG: alanine racemase [Candidatus Bathyarchaeota archaeon]
MSLESYNVRPVWAEISLDRLSHNCREVRRITPRSAAIMAAVKADAYGHGAPMAAKTFLKNGATSLAVANLDEAVELRNNGVKAQILVLGYIQKHLYTRMLRHGVTPTIYQVEQARSLSETAQEIGEEAKIHVKLDTGLGRLGFPASPEAVEAVEKIVSLPGIMVEGIYSHFATAYEADKTYTRVQFNRFMATVEGLESRGVEIPVKHISNSAALIDFPEYSLDMVRPGSALYGLHPGKDAEHTRIDSKICMTLKAKPALIKTVPKGAGISYGLVFKTERESRIATLPIGYADGYRRSLTNKGQVAINGVRAPVVGRVCMDQCMVDVTDIEDLKDDDEVVLFGDGSDNSPHIEEVAEWAGSINEEIVCNVSRRVPRVYLRGGEVVAVRDYLNPEA